MILKFDEVDEDIRKLSELNGGEDYVIIAEDENDVKYFLRRYEYYNVQGPICYNNKKIWITTQV